MKVSYLSIFAIVFLSMLSIPAFAQIVDNSISVTTDKSDYSKGETIVITGKVRDMYSGFPVTITVVSPLNSIISITQELVNPDKKFKAEIYANGNSWKYDGIYTIKVSYLSAENYDTTTFNFINGISPIPEDVTIPSEFTVKTTRSSYDSGDSIIIIGSIKPLAEYSQSVTIVVVSPDENIITITNFIPDSDGNFLHTMKAGGTMNVSGDYEIRAQYGSAKTTNTFYYSGDVSEPVPEPIPEAEHDKQKIIKLKNKILQLENEKSKLHSEINKLNLKIDNLNHVLMEQIKIIMDVIKQR